MASSPSCVLPATSTRVSGVIFIWAAFRDQTSPLTLEARLSYLAFPMTFTFAAGAPMARMRSLSTAEITPISRTDARTFFQKNAVRE